MWDSGIMPEVWKIIAVLFTLAIFSFLYRDNPVYKFAEHLMVGLTVGYAFTAEVIRGFYPRVYQPIVEQHNWFMLLPFAIGILYLSRFFPKWGWLSRYPISISVGFGAGYSIPLVIQASIVRQIEPTLLPLWPLGWTAFCSLIIFIGVLCSLIYFFFSKEHKGSFGVAATIGIVFLMVGFGATFGNTVMARISLLIGRLQFLMGDWLGWLS